MEVTEDSPDNIISLGTRTPEKGIQHVHALVMAKGNDPKIEANIKVLQTEIEKLDLTRDEQIAVCVRVIFSYYNWFTLGISFRSFYS